MRDSATVAAWPPLWLEMPLIKGAAADGGIEGHEKAVYFSYSLAFLDSPAPQSRARVVWDFYIPLPSVDAARPHTDQADSGAGTVPAPETFLRG